MSDWDTRYAAFRNSLVGHPDPRGAIEAWMDANPRTPAAPAPSLFSPPAQAQPAPTPAPTPAPPPAPSLFSPQPQPTLPAALHELLAPPQQPAPQPQNPIATPAAPIQFTPPPAPPPSQTFLEQAKVNPGGPAPAPVPLVTAPSGGLIQAQDYTPPPESPGYAQARSGSPFRAQQAPPMPNLLNLIAAQPSGQPQPASEDEMRRRAIMGGDFSRWY